MIDWNRCQDSGKDFLCLDCLLNNFLLLTTLGVKGVSLSKRTRCALVLGVTKNVIDSRFIVLILYNRILFIVNLFQIQTILHF